VSTTAVITASPECVEPAERTPPRFLETYGLSYAFGLLLLLPAVVLISSQPEYSFTTFYTLMLTIPPIAASFLILATDPPELRAGRLLGRGALLTVLATVGSILAVMVGTPVVILLFLNGVGHSQALTGIVSAVGLLIVGSPMVFALVSSVRAESWLRALVLVLGIAALAILIALVTSQGGVLVESMRRDQGEILMGLLIWVLPSFAITTAFVRRHGLV